VGKGWGAEVNTEHEDLQMINVLRYKYVTIVRCSSFQVTAVSDD
jgi:hypothetical protein